jgi:phenylpropionate dioxygenase-like ring-hydroxylating dioxygenase large terminal subunit
MATQVSFLNDPYSGYLHSQVPLEDGELTHVGPGTPAGEWFRRFWQPVAVSNELGDLPKAIRILGEDLVIFRDRSGRVGLLELHCSHRGTSLEFGQIEERGIRCCYHAWCYDVDGKILDTPGEPADSTLRERLYHGAYPTHEYGGLVFAYMGPPERKPPFPVFDTFEMRGYHSEPGVTYVWPCNWLNIRDNAMDPVHFRFLHTIQGNQGFTKEFEEVGELDFIETPLGVSYIDTRRVGGLAWVRVTDFMPPNMQQGCDLGENIEERDGNGPTVTRWAVPIDDTHTMQIGFWHATEGDEVSSKAGFGQTLDRPYEQRQRTPGDYDAMTSQRPIAVHALEHLGSSDRGLIMMRNVIRRGVYAVQNGEDPQGAVHGEGEVVRTYSHERVVPLPLASSPEEDRQLLLDTGRKVAEDFIRAGSPR